MLTFAAGFLYKNFEEVVGKTVQKLRNGKKLVPLVQFYSITINEMTPFSQYWNNVFSHFADKVNGNYVTW